jgi:large subunit ribosomal protein L17
MNHKIGHNKLDRRSAHRKALHKNMVLCLFREERIKTTKAKALAIRRTAEKMITKAKVDSVHNRRQIARSIHDEAILNKLFTDIAVLYKQRAGGYTRVFKLGARPGDAAEIVLLELVDRAKPEKDAKKKKTEKKG